MLTVYTCNCSNYTNISILWDGMRIERDESRYLNNIQERIKYESIYAIDVSVIHYEYMRIFKILNGYIRTHIYFIYREYMSRNSTVIIVLTSLPYVITMMNVVRNRVMRVYFYSQISYTRSVDIDTWMYCWTNKLCITLRASNGLADISLARYLLHEIWNILVLNRGNVSVWQLDLTHIYTYIWS